MPGEEVNMSKHYVPEQDNQAKNRNAAGSDHSDSDFNPASGEMALWKAVITQALMDAGSESKKPEAQHEKAKAIRWLLGFSEDFVTVCLNAGKNPERVRDDAKAAIARGCVWRQGMAEKRQKNSTMATEQKHARPTMIHAMPAISVRGKKLCLETCCSNIALERRKTGTA